MYGNFRRYYGMRRARAVGHEGSVAVRADGVDERVLALVAWCKAHATRIRRIERVLDVGCNAAKPLLELCQLLDPPPTQAVGVDIDAHLVAQARSALRRAWSQRQPAATSTSIEAMHYFPTCFTSLMGQLPLPSSRASFPTNVTFVAQDWMDGTVAAQYDLILCLSLTKWIHLHHGDEGLVRFFGRIVQSLRPGGIVAMEIQPWQSYSQARSLSRSLRVSHARLRIRPDDMEWILCLLGMTSLGPIAQGAGFGFVRSVCVFQAPPTQVERMPACFGWPWVERRPNKLAPPTPR